jgi:hypothetical protein
VPDSIQRILSRGREDRFIDKLEPTELDYSKYIKVEDDNNISLSFGDWWQINYLNEGPDIAYLPPSFESKASSLPQVSVISLNADKVNINSYGILSNPIAILYEKYFAFEKVGDMLPIDYLPNK